MSEELDRALEKMTLARLGESYAQVIEEREELRTQLSAMTVERDAEVAECKNLRDALKMTLDKLKDTENILATMTARLEKAEAVCKAYNRLDYAISVDDVIEAGRDVVKAKEEWREARND